jgi:hypothetical protein
MAVTTREYQITQATPENIIRALETSLSDLGWMDDENLGYLLTFTNTPGSIIRGEENKRYLVHPSSTTGIGSSAVFDVLRTQTGSISAVTVVTGGSGYSVIGQITASSSGTTVTVPSTTGISTGMVVTKIAGTGTLQTNTTVVSIGNSTQLTISEAPSVALSSAVVQFADTITIGATSIGGTTSSVSATGTSGQTTITVTDNTEVLVGQRVTGTGIGQLCTVSSIAGNVITLSKANSATVSGSVTFSDEITATVTGVSNATNISGTASGLTITNVATNATVYVGAKITLLSGTPTMDTSDGDVFISTITGTGPYTLTLRNNANTFRGFDSSAAITFKASNGSTSTWFDSDIFATPLTSTFGVAKITNAANKKLGTTYWGFFATTTTAPQQPVGGIGPTLYIRSMPGYNSSTNVSQGVSNYDWFSAAAVNTTATYNLVTRVSSSPLVSLKLRVRQSGVDPNFASFSFIEGNNNRNPFYLSKYNNNTQPWDLDDVFLGSAYEVLANVAFNTSDAAITPRTKMSGLPKRQAESGYGAYFQTNATSLLSTTTSFRTSTGNRSLPAPLESYGDIMFYTRVKGDIQSNVETQAIFKNVPICPAFAPVPYYLPEDFIISEIPYGNANLGDKLVVSPTEEYTIIQFAINQITFTSIVMAARTL